MPNLYFKLFVNMQDKLILLPAFFFGLLSCFFPIFCFGQQPELVVPIGHNEGVSSTTFSPDGQLFLTGSEDKSIRLWNLKGQELQVFYTEDPYPYASISSVSFTPDGGYVIGETQDLIEVWSLAGEKVHKTEDTYNKFFDFQLKNGASSNELLVLSGGKTEREEIVERFDNGGYRTEWQVWEGICLQNSKQDTLLSFESRGISQLSFAPFCKNEKACFYKEEQPFLTVNDSIGATIYSISGDTLYNFPLPDIKTAGFTTDRKWIYFLTKTGELLFKNWQWKTIYEIKLSEGSVFHYLPTCPEELLGESEKDFVILEENHEDKFAHVWTAQNIKLISFSMADFSMLDYTQNCQDCPGGYKDVLLTKREDGRVQILNFRGEIVSSFSEKIAESNTQYQFSPDGNYLLSNEYYYSSNSTETTIWNTRGQQILLLEPNPAPVLKAFFRSDKGIAIVNQNPLESHVDSVPSYWDSQSQDYSLSSRLPEGEVFQAYSPDGRYALSAHRNEDWEYTQTFLRDLQGRLIHSFSHAGDLSDFTSDGEKIYTSDGGQTKLWKLNGEEIWGLENYGEMVTVSASGDFFLNTMGEDRGANAFIYRTTGEPREVFEDGYLYSPMEYSCVSLSSDGRFAFLGTDYGVALFYDWDNEELREFKGHTGKVLSTAIDPNKRFVLTSSEDGTVKLWDFNTTDLVITIIPVGEKDWVCKTPSGLFDASASAMQLMYYFYLHEDDYEIIELDQLKSRYYEPGLLQKLLGHIEEPIRPVGNFTTVALYPKVKASIDSLSGTLHIKLQERNGGIGKVSIFINGKEVVEEANPLPRRENAQRDSVLQFDLNQYQNFLLRHPDSTNTISIRAYNEEGWLKSKAISLDYKLPAARTRGINKATDSSGWVGQLNPKLYVVSIGTSNYTGTKLDLQYADQDATMMAKALQSVGASLFTNGDSLDVHCFSTAPADSTGLEGTPVHWQFANKKNIRATFETIKSQAKAEDVVVVYLSGHGVTQGGQDQTQFYYLTQGVSSPDDLADPATLRAYTISSEELTKWINDIPALKQVLIIDACNSGQIVEELTGGTKSLNSSQIRALDRMKDRTGMFILSGSASDKVSYEAAEFGQGLLTYSLLKGMLGVATRKTAEGDYIDVMKLFQYARDEVPVLATSINGIQTPVLGFPTSGASFDIGIFDSNMNIAIGNKKPVFIRSTFINQDPRVMRDDLGLIQLVEDDFREETGKGKNADLIYVNVTKYPGAYYLSGLYTVNEESGNIKLTANLIKDDESIPLDIPKTDSTRNLVRYLMRAVKKTLRNQ